VVLLEKNIAGYSAQSLGRFLLRARRAAGLRGSVNLLVTGNTAMRSMNLRFRGTNKPTDVLSFPPISPRNKNQKAGFAGEIAVSADIARENANRLGHSVATEIKLLALHGILHLAGYDHERDNGEMARKEASLRRALRLPDSLTERGQPSRKPGPRQPSSLRSRARSTA
jgi:probable rRNA maturation factor